MMIDSCLINVFPYQASLFSSAYKPQCLCSRTYYLKNWGASWFLFVHWCRWLFLINGTLVICRTFRQYWIKLLILQVFLIHVFPRVIDGWQTTYTVIIFSCFTFYIMTLSSYIRICCIKLAYAGCKRLRTSLFRVIVLQAVWCAMAVYKDCCTFY